MKYKLTSYSFCVLFVLISFGAFAQNKSLGVGTTAPNTNAAMHVESPTNNQGFIMPRLTTNQRNAMTGILTASDNGLMLYDTDQDAIYIWTGSAWESGSGGLSYPYKDSVTTVPGAGVFDVFALKYNAPQNARVLRVESISPTNGSSALSVQQLGLGLAGFFQSANAAATAPSITATNASNELLTPAIYGFKTGLGDGASAFRISNPANNFSAVYGETNGTGFAMNGVQIGTGGGARFAINNAANSAAAIFATTNGAGPAIFAINSGADDGFAGLFTNTEATNNYPAIQAGTKGTGSAIRAFQSATDGTGPGVDVFMLNTLSTASGVSVDQQGLGRAGEFSINNASNASAALSTITNGTGSSFQVNHTGASGNLAVFQNNSTNVARIDKTGQGFFNGGTVNSGADVAEMFDVEGNKDEYEPGDVLVISINTDRTVEKSNSPGSTKVVGVYATKPGVILTDKGIDDNLDALVPMGVIGVIPTKVCLENGPIKRGDLLITSSKQGHAMKAIPVVINGIEIYPSGAVLGKALENFESGESGLIKVLVNVK